MSRLLGLLRLDGALGRAEWLLALALLLVVCVLLHPRVLRSWRWGERAPRPTPPERGPAAQGRYRRRSR